MTVPSGGIGRTRQGDRTVATIPRLGHRIPGLAMRLFILAVATLCLSGCMCRSGVVDCTTNRSYPGFCKPLCGGPLDPFVWLAGDCSTCCCGASKCGYTPYGGRTCCGDDMVYTPSCISPPLRWAAPALPTAPSGHVVHLPPAPLPKATPQKKSSSGTPESGVLPPAPPAPPAEAATPLEDPDRVDRSQSTTGEEFLPPLRFQDARNESPAKARR